MRRIKAGKNTDAAQLRDELKDFAGVQVVEQGQDIFVDVPEETSGMLVELALQRHFPRSLLKAVADLDFDSVDFQSASTPAQVKAEAEKHRRLSKQLQSLVVRALRARWEAS